MRAAEGVCVFFIFISVVIVMDNENVLVSRALLGSVEQILTAWTEESAAMFELELELELELKLAEVKG